MSGDEVPEELVRLVRKMHEQYTRSEVEIALALAQADGPLTTAELAEETGYTERTIKKRSDSLEENLRGAPLLQRSENDLPVLHSELANALRTVEPDE